MIKPECLMRFNAALYFCVFWFKGMHRFGRYGPRLFFVMIMIYCVSSAIAIDMLLELSVLYGSLPCSPESPTSKSLMQR